jgi:NAD(P)-dependent dehydrogenase (short-subunit alcohol dehydrogenase family)
VRKNMPGTLEGKVAIVTGAGRGLGRAMVLGLLRAGVRVAAVEIDAAPLDEVQGAAEEAGASERLLGIAADVTWDESGPKIVRAAREQFGRVDILVNNAGINTQVIRGPDRPVGKLWETTPEEFRRVMEVNVVAAFLMMRAALPSLLAQHWGRIINVTTSLDTMWRNMMQPYGASKAANEAMVTALAKELDGTGVTANVLVPGGAVDTRIVPQSLVADRGELIPAEVMIPPLTWLCSRAADGVNGQRFIGIRWDKALPPEEAARKAGAPCAWQQLGLQGVHPAAMREKAAQA